MVVSSKIKRRDFIKLGTGIAALLPLAAMPEDAFAFLYQAKKLTILHTNDWHSRVEAFPLTDKSYSGWGGAAARAELIKKIRTEVENVVLLDAGDIFQGTPYFNFFGGELEFRLMSEMDYDCATLGNHDFDKGIDGLLKQLPHASFDFVNCNYDFSKTELKEKIKPFKIIRKERIKIGVFGVGIELKNLVPDSLFGQIVYNDPIVRANETAELLKHKHNCDVVICLSHLGFKYDSDKVSDMKLAANSRNIDIIIGGHTHTFLKNPVLVENLEKRNVVINQVGWAGLNLGRIDLTFEGSGPRVTNKSFSSINIEQIHV